MKKIYCFKPLKESWVPPRSQQPPLRTREGASKMEDIRKSAEALTAVRSISDKPGWF